MSGDELRTVHAALGIDVVDIWLTSNAHVAATLGVGPDGTVERQILVGFDARRNKSTETETRWFALDEVTVAALLRAIGRADDRLFGAGRHVPITSEENL